MQPPDEDLEERLGAAIEAASRDPAPVLQAMYATATPRELPVGALTEVCTFVSVERGAGVCVLGCVCGGHGAEMCYIQTRGWRGVANCLHLQFQPLLLKLIFLLPGLLTRRSCKRTSKGCRQLQQSRHSGLRRAVARGARRGGVGDPRAGNMLDRRVAAEKSS